jgi:hypothetical protein
VVKDISWSPLRSSAEPGDGATRMVARARMEMAARDDGSICGILSG